MEPSVSGFAILAISVLAGLKVALTLYKTLLRSHLNPYRLLWYTATCDLQWC
jgi:hypothetical protein